MTRVQQVASIRRPAGRRSWRHGLTVLEFAGCAVALVGGVWLGALYLGVDLRHLAHEVLVQSQMLEKVPPQWRPPAKNSLSREQLVATLREELGTLRNQIVALRAAELDASVSDVPHDPLTAAKQRTHAYWQRLNEIALGEMSLQADADSTLNDENAAKVFAIKARISRFAAKALDAVPSEAVDSMLIQFGRQLGDWYVRSAELYERAVQIWEATASEHARAQLTKQWRVAELQHRNEARLLHERATRVRGAVSRQFGQEFPEFARPAEALAEAERGAAGR